MPRKTDPIKKVKHKDGTTRYRFVIDVGRREGGGRDQRTFTFDTYQQAKAERARIISERARGAYIPPTKTTIGEYIDGWLTGKRNLRLGTIRRYEDALKAVKEHIGHIELQKLSRVQLDRMVESMLTKGRRVNNQNNAGLSPRSVNIALTILASVFNTAKKEGLVARNLVAMVERPVWNKPEMKTWTAKEAAAFLDYVKGDRLYVTWHLALFGLRRSEVLGLRWKDVDLNNRTLLIRWARTQSRGGIVEGKPKTDRGVRSLPLDDALVAAFKRLKVRQAEERLAAGPAYQPCDLCGEAHVVANELGEPMRPAWMRERFLTYTQRAGLPRIRLHDTRHTAGTLMHLRGVPVTVISDWLGHSNAGFTARTYLHGQSEYLIDAGKTLAGALRNSKVI